MQGCTGAMTNCSSGDALCPYCTSGGSANKVLWLLVACQYHGHQRSDEGHDTFEYRRGPMNDHEPSNI